MFGLYNVWTCKENRFNFGVCEDLKSLVSIVAKGIAVLFTCQGLSWEAL